MRTGKITGSVMEYDIMKWYGCNELNEMDFLWL